MSMTNTKAQTAGDRVICGCRCHAGQEGVVKAVHADGSVVSIILPSEEIALPAKDVTAAEACHG